ncbi:hypothetical protein [Gordonia rubripertincta]|uniref:hypothetical protein n=1 Tax=Gordonia rubripertincta TaxID=36822 RepID=UPI000B8D770D|nr:hypothetical protein [Gordonia rubripertincta]ASR04011.1 hypothetical protein GCWB2_16130 [Gordonia rubripertincta]
MSAPDRQAAARTRLANLAAERSDWLLAPNAIHAVQLPEQDGWWTIVIEIDGHYPDEDLARDMADYFRRRMHDALTGDKTA